MTGNLNVINKPGYNVVIVRTNRKKTASIRVNKGQVSIVVPKELSQDKIRQIIDKRNNWIRTKLHQFDQLRSIRPKEYVSGESFTYLGRNYRLKVVTGTKRSVKLIRGRLTVTLPAKSQTPKIIRSNLVRWYQSHAQNKLQEKIDRYVKIVNVTPTSVGVKTYKARWGSCNREGKLMFNWKIIIAPHRVVDYVVVHELCHLKQFDHSPQFWQYVREVLPEYEECRQWLRDNGRTLEI